MYLLLRLVWIQMLLLVLQGHAGGRQGGPTTSTVIIAVLQPRRDFRVIDVRLQGGTTAFPPTGSGYAKEGLPRRWLPGAS